MSSYEKLLYLALLLNLVGVACNNNTVYNELDVSIKPIKLSSGELVAEARSKLLNPERHSIHIDDTDVVDAIKIIQNKFGWELKRGGLHPDDENIVDNFRVSINHNNASLAEILSDLCNQTGMRIYDSFGEIGVQPGMIGCRKFSYGKDGVWMDLELGFHENTCYFNLDVITAVYWLTNNDAQVKIDGLLFPNGIKLTSLDDDIIFGPNFDVKYILENEGMIKQITGELKVPIPEKVQTRIVELRGIKELPIIIREKPYYLKVSDLKKKQDGWQLSYEHGYFLGPDYLFGSQTRIVKKCSSWDFPVFETVKTFSPFDFGYVEVLDENENSIKGKFLCLLGGDGLGGGEMEGRDTLYKDAPMYLRWTFVTKSSYLFIPFEMNDYKISDQMLNELKEQAKKESSGEIMDEK